MSPTIFFDTGPIITLVTSRLWWILPKLKQQIKGTFYITPAVKRELVDRPLETKRFEFEALQAWKLLRDGVLEVYSAVPQPKVNELRNMANESFLVKNKSIDIMQEGEMEVVASAVAAKASAVIIDERTLRLSIENPQAVRHLLEHRFQNEVTCKPDLIKGFSKALQGVPILRSTELVALAYRLGWLDEYIPPLKGGRSVLLESVLWATKVNGAAVSEEEIEELKAVLLK